MSLLDELGLSPLPARHGRATAKTGSAAPKTDPAARSYAALRDGMAGPLAALQSADATAAAKIKKVMDAAAGIATEGEYAQAIALLKDAARTLAAALPSASAARAAEGRDPSAVLNWAKMEWQAARSRADTELKSFEATVLAAFKGNPQLDAVQAALGGRLAAVRTTINGPLEAALEAALGATDANRREQLQDEAARAAARMLIAVAADPDLTAMAAQPQAPVTVQKTLTATLQTLADRLA